MARNRRLRECAFVDPGVVPTTMMMGFAAVVAQMSFEFAPIHAQTSAGRHQQLLARTAKLAEKL